MIKPNIIIIMLLWYVGISFIAGVVTRASSDPIEWASLSTVSALVGPLLVSLCLWMNFNFIAFVLYVFSLSQAITSKNTNVLILSSGSFITSMLFVILKSLQRSNKLKDTQAKVEEVKKEEEKRRQYILERMKGFLGESQEEEQKRQQYILKATKGLLGKLGLNKDVKEEMKKLTDKVMFELHRDITERFKEDMDRYLSDEKEFLKMVKDVFKPYIQASKERLKSTQNKESVVERLKQRGARAEIYVNGNGFVMPGNGRARRQNYKNFAQTPEAGV